MRAAPLLLLAACASYVPAPPAEPTDWTRIPFGDGWYAVRPDGSVGRFHRADDVAVLRAAADANPNEPAVWIAKIFILHAIDADWVDAEGQTRHTTVAFDDAQVETFRRVAATFVDWVWALSAGNVRVEPEVIVLDEPLTTLAGQGDFVHPWIEAMDARIDGHVPDGTDSVIVYWPAGDIPHTNVWGLAAPESYRGGGYCWVAYLGGEIDERAYAEVTLHEWLHQVEGPRAGRLGYSGLPALHDGGRMGYADGEAMPGWMGYYRDFMTWYMTPAMWRRSSRALADIARERPRFEGGWFREWLVAGPYPNDGDAGLDVDFIGEAEVLPGADWRALEAELIDFNPLFDPNEQAVAYAHAYVHSPDRRVAKLWVGSDDGLRVFLNGREVWRNHTHRPLGTDQDAFLILLKPGWNRLLFKVDEGIGGWALQARLSDRDGNAMSDVTVQAAQPDAGVVQADEEPVPVEGPFAWDDVREDPWRFLPEVRGLEVQTGDHFTAVGDARIDFASESLMWDGGRVFVRADAAEFWMRHLDAMEAPRVVGRLTAGSRPLIVLEAQPAVDAPHTELELACATDGQVAVNLVPDIGATAAGEPVRCRIRVRNIGDESAVIRAITVEPARWEGRRRLTAGDLWEAELTIRHAEPTLIADVEYSLDGVGARVRDAALVRVQRPLDLEVTDGAGRPLRVMGGTVEATVTVRNNRRSAVEALVDWQPEPVPLGPGEARTWTRTLEPAERLAMSAEAAGERAEWELRLQRSPWELSGTYSNENQTGFDAVYAPEEGGGEWVRWVPEHSQCWADFVDLAALFEPNRWVAAYARTTLTSQDERQVELTFGSDDTITVWLNGERVLANNVYRPAAEAQERITVTLRPGANTLMLKVCQGEGAWSFFFGCGDPEVRVGE